MKKVLIIGGVAGGASAAARIRRLTEDVKITVIERGEHVSYSNCALPFYLSRAVEDSDALVMMSPEKFKKQYNIDILLRHEAVRICRDSKEVEIKDMETGEISVENYDKLVLAPGAAPVVPGSIEGAGQKHVFTIRNVTDIRKADAYLQRSSYVAVVGGGFIGVEVCENLVRAGKKVTLIESMKQILMPFDEDMVQTLHKELYDNGVDLVLNDSVTAITANSVVLSSGRNVEADTVIMAVGIRPETRLAADAGLEIGKTGGISVNGNCQTSDPDVYAVGDAVEVYSELMHKKTRLSQAGPAQHQARAAAGHMFGEDAVSKGVLGSSVLRVFSLNAARTGLNERDLKELGIPYSFSYVLAPDKVGIMPDSSPLYLKLLFEMPTGRILGAQAIGKGEADKRIDIVAAVMRLNGTLDDLKDLELCYSPLYSTPKDALNMAALVGSNLLKNRFRQVPVTAVRELAESGACIIDVREKKEYDAGHLKNVVNIPLSEFRSRMFEIPKDRDVYLHCRSSQRSYNAVRILLNSGYQRVFNISGSFLGICLYEYFSDVTTGREPIVTAYNFN